MAALLQLVLIESETTDIDNLSLLDYTDGFDIAMNGWSPQVADDQQASVIETLTLRVKDSTHDGLAGIMQDLDDFIRYVRWSHESGEQAVWLRAQTSDESKTRQALILSLEYHLNESLYDVALEERNQLREVTLIVERTPWWEEPAMANTGGGGDYPAITPVTDINCIGGLGTLAQSITGDVPARLQKLDFIAGDAGYNRFWLGWRTSRFGEPDNFEPVWSLASGNGGTDTDSAADQSAYSGNKLTCTFASDTTLVQRARIIADDVTANSKDQAGTHLVLLRAKMSDTSVCRARIKSGWLDSLTGVFNSPTVNQRVVISGTSWLLYEMGEILFPRNRIMSLNLDNFGVGIDAERYSGSGSADFDCLVFIPKDEGLVSIKTTSNITNVTTPDELSVLTFPDGDVLGIKTTAAYGLPVSYDTADVSAARWGLPANDEAPHFIAAGQAALESGKGYVFDLNATYVRRWRTLRGNEG